MRYREPRFILLKPGEKPPDTLGSRIPKPPASSLRKPGSPENPEPTEA